MKPHAERKSFRKWALTGQHVGYSRKFSRAMFARMRKQSRA